MDDPQDLKIHRTSTADQVAEAIRARILRGELTPGTALREVSLANSMGVSRNTVREGIRALVGEGLVRHSIHRGVFVARLTERDVADIFKARGVLETAASQLRPFPELQLRQMEQAAEQLASAMASGDSEATVDADATFHRRMVEALASPRISASHSALLSELRLGLFLVDSREDAEAPAGWLADHRRILDLLREGRRRECSAAIQDHLRNAASQLTRRIREIDETGLDPQP